MKKFWISMLLVGLLAFVFTPVAFVQAQGMPIAGCPVGFDLHGTGEHMGHHEHHVGLTFDLNDDGKICVKHLKSGLHVHADNVVR